MKSLVHRLHCLLLLAFVSGAALGAESGPETPERKASYRVNPLVVEIRAATAAYKDVNLALADGYVETACASGSNGGAMGVHFVNPGLLFNADGTPNGEFDVAAPEVLIYEPLANGSLRLVGVEYIVFAAAWDSDHPDGSSPVASGQLFHFAGAPNRYRLPAFYALHVWAWKKNPSGTFADWNPNVSCDNYGLR